MSRLSKNNCLNFFFFYFYPFSAMKKMGKAKVCLSVCPSFCLTVSLSLCLSVCLSIWLSLCLYVCTSFCLFVCILMLVCLFVHLYVRQSTHPFVFPLRAWPLKWNFAGLQKQKQISNLTVTVLHLSICC
jgi:hypothetical protein